MYEKGLICQLPEAQTKVGGHTQVPSKPVTGDNDILNMKITEQKLKMKAFLSFYYFYVGEVRVNVF